MRALKILTYLIRPLMKESAGVTADTDDYVAFFEHTVPMLDVCIVASHDRLLLFRNRSPYFVCDPAANRWLVLPPSSFPPTDARHGHTARGIHYSMNESTGQVAITVVLLISTACG